MIRVLLLGREHAVVLPGQIERMELAVAWDRARSRRSPGLALYRAAAAMVGLCTRLGRSAGIAYGDAGCDALVYGGAVYNWLATPPTAAELEADKVRGQQPIKAAPLDQGELLRAAAAIYEALVPTLVPTDAEVKAKADFSGAGGAGSTSSPSGSP